MKTTKIILTVVALLALASALVSFNQAEKKRIATTKLTQMVSDWERAKAYTLEYINAANDDAINFKPTPEMRTFGQQMLHLAEANYGLAAAAASKQSPVPFGSLEKSDQYKTKAAVTKAVSDSYDYVISTAKGLDEKALGEPVKVFNFDLTRETAMAKVFEHQTHHRGQTTVYLRLKGIKPPDEKLF
ncbi:DinB family protein [Chryseolinea lacunae]|uniref:DinB family protein n=1 Tax=Chryseolinea lacunae TaxID=2801331 RepID=A0ABS1KR20_9BACT|nr:DinB family protein [Chryseolinea lacunae]MBL0741643.1 DinB family protein [Chryseolinea lacunae]